MVNDTTTADRAAPETNDHEPVTVSMIPELMNEDVLCALLNISHATAYRLRKAKKLGYCTYAGKISYLRRHVVEFLDAHEVKSR